MYGVMQLVSCWETHMVLCNRWVNERCERVYAVMESLRGVRYYTIGER